jgi:prepilin-type N-terminal cleavage/methylation domain-containing protein
MIRDKRNKINSLPLRNAAARRGANGFSLLELMLAMTIMLVLMAIAATLLRGSIGTRDRESRRTDALTSAQAALNVMSREIANSGFGLGTSGWGDNGIVLNDSGEKKLRFRANIINNDLATDDSGEDITYFYDSATQSIARYDRHKNGPNSGETSFIVNRISDVTFRYYDYTDSNSLPSPLNGSTVPTINTSRVRITVTVRMDPAIGQPDNQTVSFSSDVTLRNSDYMLDQY